MARLVVPFTKAQVKRAIEAVRESGSFFAIEITAGGTIRLVPVSGPIPVSEPDNRDVEIEL